jgi:hypothetical protein
VFIEFLKRLIAGAKREIFFDRRSWTDPHRSQNQSVCRNPEGKVAAVLSASFPDERDTVGRMMVTNRDSFKCKVRSSMRPLQNDH